ncbi:MAG: hypothetical protein KBT03_13055 [Bacteroidales bacterium]|nr:hypothetical protein [Candidatus Scybalousia scybalohippi]
MTTPEYVLKDNQLTHYALNCGYKQLATNNGDKTWHDSKVELVKLSGECFEVFYMDYKTYETEKEYFHSLTEARKFWKSLVKKYKLIKLINN